MASPSGRLMSARTIAISWVSSWVSISKTYNEFHRLSSSRGAGYTKPNSIAGAAGLAQNTKNEANITGKNAEVRVDNTKQPTHENV